MQHPPVPTDTLQGPSEGWVGWVGGWPPQGCLHKSSVCVYGGGYPNLSSLSEESFLCRTAPGFLVESFPASSFCSLDGPARRCRVDQMAQEGGDRCPLGFPSGIPKAMRFRNTAGLWDAHQASKDVQSAHESRWRGGGKKTSESKQPLQSPMFW